MRLILMRGTERVQEFAIEEGSNLIGRWDPDSGAFPEIDLDEHDNDAKISRKHAVLVRTGDRLALEDAGSRNGTFLNRGPRLEPGVSVAVKDGDEIIVGKTVLLVAAKPDA